MACFKRVEACKGDPALLTAYVSESRIMKRAELSFEGSSEVQRNDTMSLSLMADLFRATAREAISSGHMFINDNQSIRTPPSGSWAIDRIS